MSNPYISIDREAIWVKLFEVLSAALGSNVKTIGRRHIMPPDLVFSMQPAAFIVQASETKEAKPRGLPGKLTLHGFVILYAAESAANEIPGQETHLAATDLNTLKKLIDEALLPDTTDGVCTLGGLVHHCWVEGDTQEEEGIFGQQGMSVIPIHILCP